MRQSARTWAKVGGWSVVFCAAAGVAYGFLSVKAFPTVLAAALCVGVPFVLPVLLVILVVRRRNGKIVWMRPKDRLQSVSAGGLAVAVAGIVIAVLFFTILLSIPRCTMEKNEVKSLDSKSPKYSETNSGGTRKSERKNSELPES